MDLPALAMPQELAWPAAAMLGWWLGEWGYQRLGLPRVSVYGLLGFVLGASQLGVLPAGLPKCSKSFHCCSTCKYLPLLRSIP